MLRKIIYLSVVTLFIIITLINNGCANESIKGKKDMCKDNCIKISMTLDKLENLKCNDFVKYSAKKIKHQINDKRLRQYYQFKPLMSVAMREIDINSYFELIFEDGKITEINQYSIKGNFIKKHDKIYCWKE